MRTALRICPGRCRLATPSSVCVVRTNARRGCPERNYIGTTQGLRRWMGGRSSMSLGIDGQRAVVSTMPRAAVRRVASARSHRGTPAPTYEAAETLPRALRRTALVQVPRGPPSLLRQRPATTTSGARHDGVVWKRRDGVRALDQSEHHGDGSDEWENATETEPARRHPDTGPLCGIYELHEQRYREPLIGPKVRGRHEECQSNASTTTDGEGGGERPSEAQVATGDAYAYPAFVGMLSERRPDLGRRRPRLSPSLRTTLNIWMRFVRSRRLGGCLGHWLQDKTRRRTSLASRVCAG
jgi:hypothetical protein